MAGRPRRTRIYGANYNIGESYYKPTLDNLNRKQFGSLTRDSGVLDIERPRVEFAEDLTPPKPAFKRAFTEEPTLFDYRGRIATLNATSLLDDDIDENVNAALRKIRGAKKASSFFLDDASNSLEENRSKRSLDIGRALKSIHDQEDNEAAGMLTRFSRNSAKVEAVQTTSAASMRANATKERLANIESEMSERFEKQIQRENRSANLKKLLSETDSENIKALKKVTF